MASNPQLNLDDARACLARAQRHHAELRDLTDPGALWRVSEGRDEGTGEWYSRLHLDRARLIAAKPVLADCATNAWSALDQAAAAIARTRTDERLTDLYFPWFGPSRKGRKPSKAQIRKQLANLKVVLGRDALKALSGVRKRSVPLLSAVEAARQISNSGKHWQYAPASGNALAVMLIKDAGGHEMFEFPANTFEDADAFEFYRGQDRLPSGSKRIIISLAVAGLVGSLPHEPDTILGHSLRFVQNVLDAVGSAPPGHSA